MEKTSLSGVFVALRVKPVDVIMLYGQEVFNL